MSKLEANLRVAQPLVSGQAVEAVLELSAPNPVEVEYVDVLLEGKSGWHTGSGKQRRSRSETFLRASARVDLNKTLTGAHAYKFSFPFAEILPPSFTHSNAYVSYVMRATASIPWALDPHWSWPLTVDAPGPTGLRPTPQVFRRPDGVELSLERNVLGRGDILRGRIAWPLADAPREVQVVLREVVGLVSITGSVRQRFGLCLAVTVAIDPHAAGGSAFEFRLPRHLTVAFQAGCVQMHWELCVQRVEAGLLWDSRSDEFKTPIAISSAPVTAVPLQLAPPVGDARLLGIAREVATALGWSASEEGLTREVPLRGQSLSAHAMWHQRAQMVLSAEVTFPSIGLGLRVSQSSLLQRVLNDDIQVGDRPWDSAHRVEGREPAQVRAFLAPIVQFAQQNELELVYADDDSLTLERIDTQVSAESLRRFVSQLGRLLATLPLAMSQVPTPASVSIDASRALRMAEVLNGVFVPGVAGFYGSLPSGHALSSRVVLAESGAPQALEVCVSGLGEGRLEVAFGRVAQGLSGSLQACLATLGEDVRIEVDRGEGRALVRLAVGANEISPERVLQLGQWLVQASRAMSESGAFR